MSQSPTVQKLKQNETEIAVLQVQYANLNEKVGDLKTDLKDLRDHLDAHMKVIQETLKTFQEENAAQHAEVNKKISALEKWRWMMMGASVLAGALGWHGLAKMLGM